MGASTCAGSVVPAEAARHACTPSLPIVYGYCETVAASSPCSTASSAGSMPSTPTTATLPLRPASATAWAMPSAIWSLAAKNPSMPGSARSRVLAARLALRSSQSALTGSSASKRPLAPALKPSIRAALVTSPEIPPITPTFASRSTSRAIAPAASSPAASLSVPM